MITWFFMNLAAIKFAEKYEREIIQGKKITLFDVFDYYKNTFKDENATFLSEYLKAYHTSQKNRFAIDMSQEDRVSMHDITNDKIFNFKLNGKNLLEL